MAGFVYILSNPSFDGRIKIGKSSKDPSQGRVDELSSETSAPEPFKLEYYCFVDQYHKLEKLVHSELKYIRPNPKREFFIIDKEAAVKVIQNLAPQCGKIKFEECFFQIETDEEPDQQPIPDKNSEDIVENSINILDNYPKAEMVLEYNELASLLLQKLKNCPEGAIREFYSALEDEPDATNTKLQDLFDKNFKTQYLEPLGDHTQNFRYAFCLSKSPEMAAEYLNVSKTLNESVDNHSAFQRICDKYNIPQKDIPTLSDEFNSYIEHELTIAFALTSIQLKKVEDYLKHFGLNIVKNYQANNTFTLFRGSTAITDQIPHLKFSGFLLNIFDPARINNTYISENIPNDISENIPVEKNNQPQSNWSKIEEKEVGIKSPPLEPEIRNENSKTGWSKIEKEDYEINGKKLMEDFNQVPSKFLKVLSISVVAFILINILYLVLK